MGKKLGSLIRTARTEAGLTQEQLAKKVEGLSASELGRIERGEKEPDTDQIKQIAKATGVTQKSLLEAARSSAGKTSAAGKTSSSGKTASTAKADKGESMKLTAAERKLVELYREADADKRKAAVKVLKGETSQGLLGSLLGEGGSDGLLGAALDLLSKK